MSTGIVRPVSATTLFTSSSGSDPETTAVQYTGLPASSFSQAAICFSASTERSCPVRKNTNTFAFAFGERSFCLPPASVLSSTFSSVVPGSARAWAGGGSTLRVRRSANGTVRRLVVAMARGMMHHPEGAGFGFRARRAAGDRANMDLTGPSLHAALLPLGRDGVGGLDLQGGVEGDHRVGAPAERREDLAAQH